MNINIKTESILLILRGEREERDYIDTYTIHQSQNWGDIIIRNTQGNTVTSGRVVYIDSDRSGKFQYIEMNSLILLLNNNNFMKISDTIIGFYPKNTKI